VSRRKTLIEIAKQIGNIDPLELLKLVNSDISDDEFDAQMATIEGVGFLAWRSLKYKYDSASLQQALDLITPQYVDQIQNALFPIENKKKVLTIPEETSTMLNEEKSPLGQQ
jgi:hypothetical protein